MSSTNFSYGTLIQSSWLNDVNAAVYNTLPTLATKISPSFTTPNLGVATATSINKNTFTQPATSCTWTLADGKTLNVSNTLTFSGTDGASLVLGAGTSTLSGTSSGTNTGDQLTYKTVKVSGQPDVVAGSGAENLTLVAGTGVTLTTDNTAKSVTIGAPASISAMVSLAQYTATGSPTNVDFLNVFSSTYNKYLIEVENVSPTVTSNTLSLRIAVSGVVDAGASYFAPVGNGGTISTSVTSVAIGTSQSSSGLGTASVELRGINTGNTRSIGIRGVFGNAVVIAEGEFGGGAATTGFRLFWSAGAAFQTGTVRVYGVKNS